MNKALLKSKTAWFNFLTGVTAASLGFFPALAPVRAFLVGNVEAIGMMWAVVGMALRVVTKGKLVLVD